MNTSRWQHSSRRRQRKQSLHELRFVAAAAVLDALLRGRWFWGQGVVFALVYSSGYVQLQRGAAVWATRWFFLDPAAFPASPVSSCGVNAKHLCYMAVVTAA
jgi:hypothetical protein